MITYPPIFSLAAASSSVVGYLKAPGEKLRFYLFGEADQGKQKPYAVWQTVGGSPENYINQIPDADDWSTQVDVYADTPSECRAIAFALQEAFEGSAYVTSYNIEGKEADTKLFRFGYTVDWITHRT